MFSQILCKSLKSGGVGCSHGRRTFAISHSARATNVTADKQHSELDPANWQVETLSTGARLAHVPPARGGSQLPQLEAPITVKATWLAGSRFERYHPDSEHSELGMNHLVRRSLGLSSLSQYGLGITRSLQQIGAHVECTSERELLQLSLRLPDASNWSEALRLMNEQITQTAFYSWEVQDVCLKLMRADLKFLHSRDLTILLADLLHKAAYRNQALGQSLFASPNCLADYHQPPGWADAHHATPSPPPSHFTTHYFPEATCRGFVQRNLAPGRLVVSLSGVDASWDPALSADLMAELRQRLENGTLLGMEGGSGGVEKLQSEEVKFHAGGDQREELPNASVTMAALAWPLPANTGTDKQINANARVLLSALIGSRSIANQSGLLNESLSGAATAGGFTWVYSDAALLGLQLVGRSGAEVKLALSQLRAVIGSLLQNGLADDSRLQQAIATARADLLLGLESGPAVADLVTQQLLTQNRLTAIDDQLAALDAVSLSSLKSLAATVFSGKRLPAMAAVGDVIRLPFADEI